MDINFDVLKLIYQYYYILNAEQRTVKKIHQRI